VTRAGIVVMGVAGCGKTTFGQALADALGAPYLEGDALHPPGNIAKMTGGTPLTDVDRAPWLDLIVARMKEAPGIVVACSALKRSYRDRLRTAGPLIFVHLRGARAEIKARLAVRQHHFMAPSLIDSQFATLEDPEGEPGVITIDITQDPADALAGALVAIKGQGDRHV
jgi:gluconokinase